MKQSNLKLKSTQGRIEIAILQRFIVQAYYEQTFQQEGEGVEALE